MSNENIVIISTSFDEDIIECDNCGTETAEYWMVDELSEMLCVPCFEAIKDTLEELPDGYEDDEEY